MRRIKVWAGEHGGENYASEYVQLLWLANYPNIDPDIANKAVATIYERRYIHVNQTSVYPGDPESALNEEREAARVVAETKGFYGAMSMHLIRDFGLRTAYIDRIRGVSPRMLGFLRKLGMHALILTDGWGMQGHVENGMLVEEHFPMGIGNGVLERLTHALNILANDPHPPTAKVTDFAWYEYGPELHTDLYNPYEDGPLGKDWLDPLQLLPGAIVKALGYTDDEPLRILNWRRERLENGYWGETVRRTAIPDPTYWPHQNELALAA